MNPALPYIKEDFTGKPSFGVLGHHIEALLLGACLSWTRAFAIAQECGVTAKTFRTNDHVRVWNSMADKRWPQGLEPTQLPYPLALMERWAESKEAVEDKEWSAWIERVIATQSFPMDTPLEISPETVVRGMALYLLGLWAAQAKADELNVLLEEGLPMPKRELRPLR
jgi:hypothetical protein